MSARDVATAERALVGLRKGLGSTHRAARRERAVVALVGNAPLRVGTGRWPRRSRATSPSTCASAPSCASAARTCWPPSGPDVRACGRTSHLHADRDTLDHARVPRYGLPRKATGSCSPTTRGRRRRSTWTRPTRSAALRGLGAGADVCAARDAPEILEALSDPGNPVAMDAGGRHYAVAAQELSFAPQLRARPREPPRSPIRRRRALSGRARRQLARQRDREHTVGSSLLVLVAVLVLTGLGAVIARRVSAPLTMLSESARRVADGTSTPASTSGASTRWRSWARASTS